MGKGMDLFGDEDDVDVSKIEIDPEFAKRYEHNKKREDLQRYEELKKSGRLPRSSSDSEGSGSESDGDDELAVNNSRRNDIKFLDALIKVKKKDPSLKEKGVKLFDSSSESESEENGSVSVKEEKKNGKRKMYLKDVVAQQLIEHGPELDEDEDEEEDEDNINRVKSYNEEQEELRRNFLRAAEELEDGEDGGELLIVKERSSGGGDESDEEVLRNKLDECFDEEDENEKFLKEFMLNKMWEFKDEGKKVEEEVDELSDEEEELEREVSFRHEEEGVGDRVMGHSRVVEGSVRKKTNSRKLQRQSKAERMAIAELERREEVKHLKNLKKQEYEEKIKKVREIGGLDERAVHALEEDDFEEFDPDEHDRKMKELFGDEYYGADDAEFGSDRDEYEGELGKPDFDKEDKLLGLSKDWDLPDVDSDDADGVAAAERKQKGKGKLTLREKFGLNDDLEGKYGRELTEELHKFDYEDTIGDLKTRFKYTKVKPKRYGLSTEEFLMMDDKDLNQYVSLKKIAPYREKEWKVPDTKRREQKLKNKELLKVRKLNGPESGKRKSKKVDGQKRSRKIDVQESRKEGAEKSRKEDGHRIQEEDAANEAKLQTEEPTAAGKAKRKRRETKLKLQRGRLFGYGKEPPQQKHKAKH